MQGVRMSSPHIPASVLRALAVAAEADPRTIQKVLRGQRAQGMTDARIRRVLAARGIEVPDPVDDLAPPNLLAAMIDGGRR